eukprot:CAMPEP_0117451918 /NCGR_PEP_ID=MMETSP0759-20121206/9288_1 /TAXON_ID=63605 /ORGANISM="Percolomonas cosmopolitus, Strain WS" /LENGTH=825 /DNA_ID=CAMNT_0005244599 /DNA_START=212 /DNA_END=2689 /DNA_ORIENTATION=+
MESDENEHSSLMEHLMRNERQENGNEDGHASDHRDDDETEHSLTSDSQSNTKSRRNSSARKGPLAQWEERQQNRESGEQYGEDVGIQDGEYVHVEEESQIDTRSVNTTKTSSGGNNHAQRKLQQNMTATELSSSAAAGKKSQSQKSRRNRKRASMHSNTHSNAHQSSHFSSKQQNPADYDDLLEEAVSLRQHNSTLKRELDVLSFEYEKIYKFLTLHMKESSFSVESEFLEWHVKASPQEVRQGDIPLPINNLSTSTSSGHQQTAEQTIQIYQKNLSSLKQQMELKLQIKDKAISQMHEIISEHEVSNQQMHEKLQVMELQKNELAQSNKQYQVEVDHLTADHETAQRHLENLESMLLKKDHLIAEYRKENQATEKQYKTQIKQKDSILHEIKKILIKDLKQKYEMRQENVIPMTIRSIHGGSGVQSNGVDGGRNLESSGYDDQQHVSVSALIKDRKKLRRDTPGSVELRLHQLTSVENFANHLVSEIKSLVSKRDFWKRKALACESKLKQQETISRHNMQKASQLEQTARKAEQQNQMIDSLTEQLKQLKAVLKEKFMGATQNAGLVSILTGATGRPPVTGTSGAGGGDTAVRLDDAANSTSTQNTNTLQHVKPIPPAEKRSSMPHRNAPKSAPTGAGASRFSRRRMTEPAPNTLKPLPALGPNAQVPTEDYSEDFASVLEDHPAFHEDLSDIDEEVPEFHSNASKHTRHHNALPPPRNPLGRVKQNSRRRASDSDVVRGTKWNSFHSDKKKPASLITIRNVDLEGSSIIDPRGNRTAPNKIDAGAEAMPFLMSVGATINRSPANQRRLRIQSKFKARFVHKRE